MLDGIVDRNTYAIGEGPAKDAEQDITDFDFYKCAGTTGCGRIITKPEMEKALATTGKPCPCGGQNFSPIDLPWYGWVLPRVWYFAYLRLRGLK
jgi:hypothetical protein